MLDKIIVIIIVAVAFFFFARSLYRTATGKKTGCDSGCCGCNSASTCDSIPDDKRLL